MPNFLCSPPPISRRRDYLCLRKDACYMTTNDLWEVSVTINATRHCPPVACLTEPLALGEYCDTRRLEPPTSRSATLHSLIVQTLTLLQTRHIAKRLRTESSTRKRRTSLSHPLLVTLQNHPPSPLQRESHAGRRQRVLLDTPSVLGVRCCMQTTAWVPQLIQPTPV